MKIQLIVNRRNGYVYYRGENVQLAAEKWGRIKANMSASWYEYDLKETVFDKRVGGK